jgi:hypothetical protein
MKYKSGYRYVSQEAVTVKVGHALHAPLQAPFASIAAESLCVMGRYAWDGASFTPFKYFGTPTAWLTPSLVHDALYQLIREGLLDRQHRAAADRLFQDMLIERGVWRGLALVAYYAVRVCGNFAVRKTNPVREAV